jgi:hypothetical protein
VEDFKLGPEEKLTIKQRKPLIIEIGEGDKAVTKKFLGARVGLSWPSPLNPGGYFIIVGQEMRRLITGECPLMVLYEFSGLTMPKVYDTLFDQMVFHGATEIYAELSGRFENYVIALDQQRKAKRDEQEIRLLDAPFKQSFIHGNEMIKKWLKDIKDGLKPALTIPKGMIIHSQLREIREQDLKGEPEHKFFAINGLRYVLGAFEVSGIKGKEKRDSVEPIPSGAFT